MADTVWTYAAVTQTITSVVENMAAGHVSKESAVAEIMAAVEDYGYQQACDGAFIESFYGRGCPPS